MKKLYITSVSHLEDLFKGKSVDMTNSIRNSIQEAIENNKKTAQLFEIEVEGLDSVFEISITSREFQTALENCLKHYQEWEMYDDEIDTWQLLEKLKV